MKGWATMENWDRGIQQDHEGLMAQVGAMEAALSMKISEADRWTVLHGLLTHLWPNLELHLRKEREVLIVELERTLGKMGGSKAILLEEQEGLKKALRHLAELIQDRSDLDWFRIAMAVQNLIHSFGEHESIVQRLLMDTLAAHSNSIRLNELADRIEQLVWQAYTEEGWPRIKWDNPSHPKRHTGETTPHNPTPCKWKLPLEGRAVSLHP